MAPAVKLWTRCLQDLQQFPVDNDPAAVALIAVKLQATLTQWRELPPLSARDWRKLVLEVKVPDVLFEVCYSAVQHSQSQGVTAAAITAFAALYEFFQKANDNGGFLFQTDARSGVNSTITNRDSASSSSSSSALSLAPGIRSQVLQSGLMGAFAAAMTAAADVLVRHPPQHQPATQTSASSSTAGAGAGHSKHVPFKTQGNHFAQLLQSWHWVCRLWPAGREQVAAIAVAAPAAVQLSAAIMQVVSRDLPAAVIAAAVVAAAAETPQSRGSEDHTSTSGAVDTPKSYAVDLCSAMYSVQHALSWLACYVVINLESRDAGNLHGMPELRLVLAMPELTTALATMAVVLIQALFAQQWLGPTAAANATHNTSSRSSSNSNDDVRTSAGSGPLPSSNNSSISSQLSTVSTVSGVMSSLLSTKMTRKLEEVSRNLPECTKALLDTLGMDSRAMVWAAAAHRHQARARALAAIAGALVAVVAQQPVQDERQQQQLFLIPATLLHWASNTRIKGLEEARECTAIAAGSCTSFINRLCSSFPKQSAQQQDADQLEGAAPEGLEAVTPAELKQVLPMLFCSGSLLSKSVGVNLVCLKGVFWPGVATLPTDARQIIVGL